MATGKGQDWTAERSHEYWKRNVTLQASLLTVWFVVAYVLGILLAEPFDSVSFFNFPLGFWIAQNGSIYVFIALIFIYAWRMDALDHEFDVHEEDVSAAVRERAEKRATKRSQRNGGGQA